MGVSRLPHVARRIYARAAVVTASALLTGITGAAHASPSSITATRARINQLNQALETLGARENTAVEAYNGAQYRLGVVTTRIRDTSQRLHQATIDQTIARARLSNRLVSIYRNTTPDLTAAVLANNLSLTDLAAIKDFRQRLAANDAAIAQQIRTTREQIKRSRFALIKDRRVTHRQLTVALRNRHEISAVLGQRRRLLAHEQGTLAALQAAERREQAIRAEATRTRLAQELRAQQVTTQQPQAPASQPQPQASNSPAQGAPSSGGGGAGRPDVVAYALQFLGTPYVWGGAAPGGFDCSGLTQYAYAHFGINMIHYTGSQYSAFPHVAKSDLQPGDLVFFHNLGHEGMYIGNGQFLHAPHTGDVVKISNMSDAWYVSGYVGAVRPY